MHTGNGGLSRFDRWNLDPFGELRRLLGVPHVVGRASVVNGKVHRLEIGVILNETEKGYSFFYGDEVYFMPPAKPEDGIEGIYCINRLLGGAQ